MNLRFFALSLIVVLLIPRHISAVTHPPLIDYKTAEGWTAGSIHHPEEAAGKYPSYAGSLADGKAVFYFQGYQEPLVVAVLDTSDARNLRWHAVKTYQQDESDHSTYVTVRPEQVLYQYGGTTYVMDEQLQVLQIIRIDLPTNGRTFSYALNNDYTMAAYSVLLGEGLELNESYMVVEPLDGRDWRMQFDAYTVEGQFSGALLFPQFLSNRLKIIAPLTGFEHTGGIFLLDLDGRNRVSYPYRGSYFAVGHQVIGDRLLVYHWTTVSEPEPTVYQRLAWLDPISGIEEELLSVPDSQWQISSYNQNYALLQDYYSQDIRHMLCNLQNGKQHQLPEAFAGSIPRIGAWNDSGLTAAGHIAVCESNFITIYQPPTI